VLCEAGVQAAVGGLEQLVRQWRQAQPDEQETRKQPCVEFASRIIANWPESAFASGQSAHYRLISDEDDLAEESDEDCDDRDEGDAPGGLREQGRPGRVESEHPASCLLSLLADLGEVSLISAWIRSVLTRDASVNPSGTLGELCRHHGWARFREGLLELFEATSHNTLERHALLLAEWSQHKDRDPERKKLCTELAQRIMSAVEQWDPEKTKHDWRTRVVDRQQLLPSLAQAFLALESPQQLERLVACVLQRAKQFDLRRSRLRRCSASRSGSSGM
jgi:hypothetical protein